MARDNGERDLDVRAELNLVDGTAKVFVQREVVEEVGVDSVEISLEDAKKRKKDAVLGDIIEDEFEVVSFGRVAAQTANKSSCSVSAKQSAKLSSLNTKTKSARS